MNPYDEEYQTERLIDYVCRNDFFVSSNPDQDEAAERAVKSGFLQPVENLCPNSPIYRGRKSHFYVRGYLTSSEQMPTSVYNHIVLGVKS